MKRPPGLWILLSAGLLWLTFDDVNGIRATALIFGKSTTTTTSTTPQPENVSEEEGVTTEQSLDPNSTKPTLTGIPQQDYVWDPNLPKELNGYNLSDYPFYERVPEDIDFKCDGLHDGFYASVKHKCQVYHHCLFGIRYDFLCANYTAFDQTLFNCNFVSNVDCQNSKKFWHRNDELYKTKSTTTAAPVIYNFRTPPSAVYSLTPSPVGQITPEQLAVIQQAQPAVQSQIQPVLPVIPIERRRPRPASRRRPAYDYYDYEERPIRERPRSRPYYYEYDDYEEDRYERRGGRRRRPYDRRPMRRDKDRRRKYEYDYEEDEDYEYEDFTLGKKRRGDKRRKPEDDYEEEDVRTRNTRRRPDGEGSRKKPKRPQDDAEEPEDRKRRPQTDSSSKEQRKPTTRLGVRRPPSEVYEDDLQEGDYDNLERRRKNKDGAQTQAAPTDGSRTVIKPVSGTLYDRPRLAPKISLPVPKNAAHKYAYKPIGSPTAPPSKDIEEYDEAQDPAPVETKKNEATTTTIKPIGDVQIEDSSRSYKRTKLESNNSESPRVNIRRRPIGTSESPKDVSSIQTEETPLTSAQEDTTSHKTRTIMRKFRRPFLPSRGGNPYTARNLKPVGDKSEDSEAPTAEADTSSELISAPGADDYEEEEEIQQRRPDKTKPVRVKSPLLVDISAELRRAAESERHNNNTSTTKVKLPVKLKPLADIRQNKEEVQEDKPAETTIEQLYENYDETLNEASPVLSFPFQKFPTGPGNSNNYIYNNRFYRSTKLASN